MRSLIVDSLMLHTVGCLAMVPFTGWLLGSLESGLYACAMSWLILGAFVCVLALYAWLA